MSTATEPTLKVGVMSFAHTHAIGYVSILQARDDVELRVSDPRPSDSPGVETRGRELAQQLGADYAETYEELLAWGPDAVVVCSENVHHRADVELAAAAGAHVLCEKPLATEVEDARAMIEACERAGVELMTAYPVRFSPMVDAISATLDAGRLGEVVGITGTNNGKIPLSHRSWFTDPALSGGGSIVDHTVHVADLLDLLLDARATTVHCAANQILHADDPRVGAETGGLVTVTFDDGVVATIDCSWSVPRTAPTWGGLTLEVLGTAGSAHVDPFAPHVGGMDAADGTGIHLGFGVNADALMVEEFLGAIREGRRPQPDAQVGLRTLQIVKAAQESARTGEPVAIG